MPPPPSPSGSSAPSAPTGLSVQLYTVREAVAQDLSGTLSRIAGIGFTQVEPYSFTSLGEALREGLDDAGLSAPTAHQHFLGEPEAHLETVFAAAAALRTTTVIDPSTAPERWQDVSGVEQVADQLNAAAVVAARHGVRVGYHNHAHELASVLGGTTALEVLAAALDDAVVLEVDAYWAVVGGQDPVALLGRLGERVAALHVKDGPGTADTADQVAVGAGSLPIPAIIAAAPHALRVVELDDSRGDRFTAVADSFAYLARQALA